MWLDIHSLIKKLRIGFMLLEEEILIKMEIYRLFTAVNTWILRITNGTVFVICLQPSFPLTVSLTEIVFIFLDYNWIWLEILRYFHIINNKIYRISFNFNYLPIDALASINIINHHFMSLKQDWTMKILMPFRV